MKQRNSYIRAMVPALFLIVITTVASLAISLADAKIKTAIECTQSLQAAISRCMSADDKACADGIALAKVAKEATETALNQSELKDGAKSHLRTAIDHFNAVIGFLGQGRASEAHPVAGNALSSLAQAEKAS